MVTIGFRGVLAWALAYMVAFSSTPAHAEPSPEPALPPEYEKPRPWAVGVSEDEQAIARALYVAGNHEITESHFTQALARYREAIRHWDNPAIRYNMAVCLINLDQPVEARDNLERSLAYGADPLGADLYAQGLTYRKLLDAQLAHVKIVCREPGAVVTLDGKLLFTAPGMADQFLLPGDHQVVATKVGFLTASKTLVLVAGKLTTDDIRPTLEVKPTTRMVRHWERWKPWAVLAGGGAMIALGAGGYAIARSSFAAYDHGIAGRCPDGCDAATVSGFSDLRHTKKVAGIEQVVAFSLFSAGGAAVITGVLGLVANQPQVRLDSPRALPVVTPTRDGATVSMKWGF